MPPQPKAVLLGQLRLPSSTLGPRGAASYQQRRLMRMATAAAKKEGDISSVFVSLSGAERPALPPRFTELKRSLVRGNEDAVSRSWMRLLEFLKSENDEIARRGSAIIPSVDFANLDRDLVDKRAEIRRRGVAVIRGVVPEDEARAYKFAVEDYVRKNPSTRAFPQDKPQVFELYWSLPQLQARSHPNLIATQHALMRHLWTPPSTSQSSPGAAVSLSHPITYADRLRIRQPGDATFALGPHIDGGGVERWETKGYGGRDGVYRSIFAGAWHPAEANGFDAWEAGPRAAAVQDLYNGAGACSVFRAFQGWLAMSESRPGEGTLQVYPSVAAGAAYLLLRPFFRPRTQKGHAAAAQNGKVWETEWEMVPDEEMTSELHGATPGHGQELGEATHPHLELRRTMVGIPEIRPGDFVVWHCDSIHAVDKVHRGRSDSSVLYIPVCPLTEANARYMVRQRDAFRKGTPGPDFPGGKGEADHVDRPLESDLRKLARGDALMAMGLEPFEVESGATEIERKALHEANGTLGF